MVGMAGLQVFVVRFFFQGARKGEFFFFACSFWVVFWWSRRCVGADFFV